MALFGLIPEIPANADLRMTAEEAKREALGKALGLIGTTIGITGTIMALSVNPAMKQATTGAFSKLPKSVQDNRISAIIGVGLLSALVLYKVMQKQATKQVASRMK